MHSYARICLSIVEAESQKVWELTPGAGKIKCTDVEGAGFQHLRSALGSEASRSHGFGTAAHTGVGSSFHGGRRLFFLSI